MSRVVLIWESMLLTEITASAKAAVLDILTSQSI